METQKGRGPVLFEPVFLKVVAGVCQRWRLSAAGDALLGEDALAGLVPSIPSPDERVAYDAQGKPHVFTVSIPSSASNPGEQRLVFAPASEREKYQWIGCLRASAKHARVNERPQKGRSYEEPEAQEARRQKARLMFAKLLSAGISGSIDPSRSIAIV